VSKKNNILLYLFFFVFVIFICSKKKLSFFLISELSFFVKKRVSKKKLGLGFRFFSLHFFFKIKNKLQVKKKLIGITIICTTPLHLSTEIEKQEKDSFSPKTLNKK